MVYIYTMEYYLATKRNTFESVLMRWMDLEPIIQGEVSQKEKKQMLYINASLVAQMVESACNGGGLGSIPRS